MLLLLLKTKEIQTQQGLIVKFKKLVLCQLISFDKSDRVSDMSY